jgi:hypothetical protein
LQVVSEARPQNYEGRTSWRQRVWIGRLVRATLFVIPVAVAVLGTTALGKAFYDGTWPLVAKAAWFIAMFVVAGAVSSGASRAVEGFVPLAALCQVNLEFPTAAPNRLKTALRNGSTANRARVLEQFQTGGLSTDPQTAAEQVLSLIESLNRHDRRTRGHSERVRALADVIGEEMGLSEKDRTKLRWAAMLHDIGKLAVDPAVLNKAGRPNEAEWEQIKGHPGASRERLEPLRVWLGDWIECAWQHHERVDGTGYPLGLRGDQMPVGSRIVAVADAFEVMTAARSYKKPMSFEDARAELVRCSGTHFDPVVVRAFLRVGRAPVRATSGLVSSWVSQLQAGNGPISIVARTVADAGATGGTSLVSSVGEKLGTIATAMAHGVTAVAVTAASGTAVTPSANGNPPDRLAMTAEAEPAPSTTLLAVNEDILRRLEAGEDPIVIRNEAAPTVETVAPETISFIPPETVAPPTLAPVVEVAPDIDPIDPIVRSTAPPTSTIPSTTNPTTTTPPSSPTSAPGSQPRTTPTTGPLPTAPPAPTVPRTPVAATTTAPARPATTTSRAPSTTSTTTALTSTTASPSLPTPSTTTLSIPPTTIADTTTTEAPTATTTTPTIATTTIATTTTATTTTIATTTTTLPPTGCGTQWRAEYFNNLTLSDEAVLTTCAPTINHRWLGDSPGAGVNSDFSARYTADISFATSAIQTFEVVSDDGVRVWVDGTLVIDQWAQGPIRSSIEDHLVTAGTHRVVVEFYDDQFWAALRLTVRSGAANGIPNPVVPVLGTIQTFAEFGDGSGNSAMHHGLSDIHAIAAGPAGLYVANSNSIYLIDGANVTRIAGSGGGGSTGDGGPALLAEFNDPAGLAYSSTLNTLYVSDTENHRIRAINLTTGIVSAVAGGDESGNTGDGGSVSDARFNEPEALTLGVAGELYVVDSGNHRVRKVVPGGSVSAVVGKASGGVAPYAGQIATNAHLQTPKHVVVDPSGAVIVADEGRDQILMRVESNKLLFVAGAGSVRDNAAFGESTDISQLHGLATLGSSGLLYSDKSNDEIRLVLWSTNQVFTVAGTGTNADTGDGGPALAAGLKNPEEMTSWGFTVYVRTASNGRIRKIG